MTISTTGNNLPMFPKPGTVRLKGKKMEALRVACFLRDRGRCKQCARRVALTELDARWDMPVMHLAHIRSRGAGGEDQLFNVRVLCPECHIKEHNGGKPCPKKERSK